jgi:putative transposase
MKAIVAVAASRLTAHPSDKPVENAHIESFNGRLRDECLNVQQLVSLEDARRKIEAWRLDYNQQRLARSHPLLSGLSVGT